MASIADEKGRLVGTEEAARLLGLSPRTLEKYRDQDVGPRFFKLGPGARAKVAYKISDLDAWLETFVHEPKNPGPKKE